jgi:Fur family transcriptional regulator, stress-responsive regulator
MAGKRPRVVDEAAAIAGEAHPLRHRMQVAERIDTVPARHVAVSRGGREDFTHRRNLHIVSVMALDPADLLREQGFKVTAQRLAVLRAVSASPHLTAEDLVEVVRADIAAVSRRAIYDAVNILADMGLLRRIQPAGSAARYESRVGDNHHHLICRTCARMVDVDCAVGATPCLTAADDAGYDIDEAEVIYWGRCPTCRQAAEGA